MTTEGKVVFIGAPFGDPQLLTLRAVELLGRADLVVHEPASAAVARLAVDARRITVDTSDEAVAVLSEAASAGRVVVRLCPDAPLARPLPEITVLYQRGIPIELVPGTDRVGAALHLAGLAAPNLTVPATNAGADPVDDLPASLRRGAVVAIDVGAGPWSWPELAARLGERLTNPSIPVWLLTNPGHPDQRTRRATPPDLAGVAAQGRPDIVVIGATDEPIAWFETRPLSGRRVVVTRSRSQASGLSTLLLEAGADVIEVPTITIVDPADGGVELRAALARVSSYDWVVLTSPNGAERMCALLRDARQLAGVKLACIGPGTAQVLARHRLVADLVPERYVAEGLLEVFPPPPPTGGRVLLPRAAIARDALPEGLNAAGWSVDVVEAYRTERPVLTEAQRAALATADTVTFTSSSTVTNFVVLAGAPLVPPVVACIGPITAATAREQGLEVAVEAPEHTMAGLVQALIDHAAP